MVLTAESVEGPCRPAPGKNIIDAVPTTALTVAADGANR
jgi:hypothetical protein